MKTELTQPPAELAAPPCSPSDVIRIRCIRHINVPQQNASESTGAECGGCIAEQRDQLLDSLERYCCAIDFGAPVTNSEVCMALRAIAAKANKV